MISFILGGLFGIGIMCLLQINRDNELQNRINKVVNIIKSKQGVERATNGIMLFPEYRILKILGGDVDDE